MLEGTSISRPVSRAEARGGSAILAVQPGVDKALLLFLLLLVAASALTCLYVYQVNAITKIQNETWYTKQEIARLDLQIAPLQLELAQWQAPQVIDSESAELGMKTGGPALRSPVLARQSTPGLATVAPDQPGGGARGAVSAAPMLRTIVEWLSARAVRAGVQLPLGSVLGYR